jgi:hypothetical protein
MTMNYVVADFEDKMWRMAPAARDDFGQKTALHLTSLCIPTNTSAPTPPQHPTNRTAAIAGGVGGGVGGVLLISGLFALIFLLHRRKRRVVAQRHQSHGHQQQGDKAAYSETTKTTELPSSTPNNVTSWMLANHGQGFESVRLDCFSLLFSSPLSFAQACY